MPDAPRAAPNAPPAEPIAPRAEAVAPPPPIPAVPLVAPPPAVVTTPQAESRAASSVTTLTPGSRDGASRDRRPKGGRRGGRIAVPTSELPRLVHAPKPPYPSRARDLGEEGTVIVAILVDDQGGVAEARIVRSSGSQLLDGSALTTVRRKWRFQPGSENGEPISRWVRVPVEFRISR